MTNLELMQYIFEHIYLFYHSYDSFPCEKKIALHFTSHKIENESCYYLKFFIIITNSFYQKSCKWIVNFRHL